MTHNELLDYLREHEEYWTSLRATRWSKVPAFNALKLVIEFHKPYHDGVELCCKFCEETYPCNNIKLIEKELG